ncbi:acyl-CoA dehydrogenase family protein [Rhizobiaceae bacterium n13]|uniref:Acyl-CoA dehydrogenase family protein n=1 Tax=Ferirhizobium litorale TaxID=2927786 RepID=A0AAE3U3D6_9HYPH|nr:acyl-CoA dehydrogenase family protein [Fererhizobium litorale]MDI7861789.1 acyl-CoA dehydrogenase family protein [Fererhizobium litorale]MDI7921869.1 acyl-CoA dehydrogenase family protein [Fererhizobium litorale]
MSFAFTDTQLAVRDMAEAFAREEIAPSALQWDEEKVLPLDVLRRAAALGMAAIYTREGRGGSGLGRFDAVLIFEALARGCPTISAFLSIHNMATWMIDRWGVEPLRAELVPKLAAMDLVASYCLTEPGSGSDAAALSTRARRDGDYYVVDGTKQFISGAGLSDIYVTMVRTGGEGPSGISALVIPKETPGISFGANERKMGWHAQPTRSVTFDGCHVPVGNRLGEEGEGFRLAMKGLDGGRLNIAACSLGGAEAALERTLAYMKERKAFGRKLEEFQALQFRLADMATTIEASRALLYSAADALDRGAPDATARIAMAKRFVTDSCFDVVDEALQLHGGYGYLAEFGIEKLVRDLRVHRILEGTNEIMRMIVARSLLKGEMQ